MSQEDKDLLFKDLCARLPYGIIFQSRHNENGVEGEGTFDFRVDDEFKLCKLKHTCELDNCKPYLRPLDSITEEEEKELHKISNCHLEKIKCYNKKTNCCDLLKVKITNNYTPFGTFEVESEYSLVEQDNILAIIDYLNSHHFDYRGLIEKGLAIEAPEGMYK